MFMVGVIELKYFLFYMKASLIAPFHFRPKKCPYLGKGHCPIWNCKWHYKDKKYSDCQRIVSGNSAEK